MFYSKSKSQRRFIIAVMLLPALLFVVILLAATVAISGLQSLGYFPLNGQSTISLDAYQSLFLSSYFVESMLFSLGISFVATVCSAIIAVLIALRLRRYTKEGGLLHFILQFNLPIPHVVGAIALWMLLGQSGLFARLLYALGIIDQPSQFPVLIADQYGIGIILEYVWKEVPFIAVTVLSILKSWVIPYERQLQVLGANAWQRWRLVTFPFMLPPLLASSILVFAYTFGSFEVPYVLGSVSKPTLPILAYEAYLNPDLAYRPEAMAINFIITMISAVLIVLYMKWGEGYASNRAGS